MNKNCKIDCVVESVCTPTLKTERLIIRKFFKEDMDALYAIFSDKDVNTYLPWFPLKSLQEAINFYQENYFQVYEQSSAYKYAICLKIDNVPIGYINISMEENHDFGYGLHKNYWNKGIITEACVAVINYLKANGFSYITATHDVKNTRSGSIMKKLGMSYRYSYEEQWQPKDLLVTFRMYQLNFDEENTTTYRKYWDESIVHFIESDI